jgi:hypothetical protein
MSNTVNGIDLELAQINSAETDVFFKIFTFHTNIIKNCIFTTSKILEKLI